MTTSAPTSNATYIKDRTEGFTPRLGIVLGSGLGALADQIQQPISFPFDELQGFHQPSVKGHTGTLTLGHLWGLPVACLKGRPHYYEGHDHVAMQTPIYTLKALGCQAILLTNAAASLRPEVQPGRLVVIKDHINFSFHNPLVGPNSDEFGTRFPGMEDAYDPGLRDDIFAAAKQQGIELTDGVYCGVLGPCYETAAEIRAIKVLGGDVVGMSTVPEVIVARHCGLKVAVISSITNMGTGLSNEKLSHDNVLKVANQAASDLIRLLQRFIESHISEQETTNA